MIIQLMMGARPGGIEVLVPSIVKHYQYEAMLVYVVNDKPGHNVFSGTDIVPIKGGKDFLQSSLLLYKFVRGKKKAIWHGYNLGPVYLLLLRLAGARRIVYSIHGTKYWRNRFQRAVKKTLWSLALAGDDNIRLICNTAYSGRMFSSQIKPSLHPHIVYNPIDTAKFFCSRTNYPNLPHSIIYVGRLAKGKNLFLWLDIIRSIADRYADTEFHLYGDGPLKDALIAYAESLQLRDRVTFHGYTREVEKAYREGELLLFLSEYESFGNVAVESILSGTPVICSDIPSMREIFSEYPEFLVKLDDGTKFSVLNKLLDYPALVEQAKEAQTKFLTKYSIEGHIEQLHSLYSEFG